MKKIDYPYLPEGRTIQYVSADNPFMKIARETRRTLSTERNHSTGAVVVLNNKIIAQAGNQARIRNKILAQFHKKYFCMRRLLKIKTGEKYWLCPGCAPYSTHAETLAVRSAVKTHGSAEGADIYLYGHWWCCKPCWDEMISRGIKDVYLLEGSEVMFDRNNPENSISKV